MGVIAKVPGVCQAGWDGKMIVLQISALLILGCPHAAVGRDGLAVPQAE